MPDKPEKDKKLCKNLEKEVCRKLVKATFKSQNTGSL